MIWYNDGVLQLHHANEPALLTKWVWHVTDIDDHYVTTSRYYHSRVIVAELHYQVLCCFSIIVMHQSDGKTLQIPWITVRWEG